MKVTKTMMHKALLDGAHQYEALLELSNATRQDTGISPVEMMFDRNTRSMLRSGRSKKIRSKRQVTLRRAKRCFAIKRTSDKGVQDLSQLQSRSQML